MIDFHCHLDLYPNPAEVVAECARRGLYVLSVTTTPSAWNGTSALSARSDRIRTALGFHPQLAHERRNELALFDALLPAADYIGEIGLDGSPEHRPHWDSQIAIFDHVLQRCGADGGRIMSVHSRRASGAVLDHLEKHRVSGAAVLHWFSGSFGDLERAVRLGCWFSIGPAMTAGERGRALVARMPRDRVLTESDGPFAQLKDAAVMPWQVEAALQALGAIWNVQSDEADRRVRKNFESLLSTHSRAKRAAEAWPR